MKHLSLSGDTILISDNQIVKICNTNQERFLKNVEKQKLFNNPYISAVSITEQGVVDNKNYIKMPYLKCPNSIVWISISGIDSINQVISTLKMYFWFLFSNSAIKKFDYESWQQKLNSVNIDDPSIKNIVNYLHNLKFSNHFYYGNYHGDLTLSNIFITGDNDNIKIEAFDFLDTYIQSPINDLVKFRQDTKHLWTLTLMENFNIDKNKVITILDYIDKELEKFINSDPIIAEFYGPLQILNLIRILPYSKDNKLTNYLKKEIKDLFNELHSNNALCR